MSPVAPPPIEPMQVTPPVVPPPIEPVQASPVAAGTVPAGAVPAGYVPAPAHTPPAPAARPEPGASPPPAIGYPAQPPPAAPAPPARRRVADVVASGILLLVGLIALIGASVTAIALPSALQSAYDDYSLGEYVTPPGVAGIQTALWLGSLVIFLVATGLTVLLIVKRRISFYVPIIAGFVTTLLYWGLIVGAVLSDETLMAALTS